MLLTFQSGTNRNGRTKQWR